MTDYALVALLGFALAGGLLLMLSSLRPSHPDLSAATATVSQPTESAAPGGWEMRVGGVLARWLLRREHRLPRAPVDDLRVLGRPVEMWIAQKIVLGLLGLLSPALLATLAAMMGTRPPFVIPALVSVIAGVVLFLFPDWVVRDAAKEARTEFRHAVAVYVGWVAMARAATGGPAESLERAADVGQGWALGIIRRALVRARYSSQTPWEALASLGELYRVPQLTDLASIMSTAGSGGSVYDTLMAKGQSLLAAELADQKALANARSERMDFPVVGLLVCFVILLGYPLLASIS